MFVEHILDLEFWDYMFELMPWILETYAFEFWGYVWSVTLNTLDLFLGQILVENPPPPLLRNEHNLKLWREILSTHKQTNIISNSPNQERNITSNIPNQERNITSKITLPNLINLN